MRTLCLLSVALAACGTHNGSGGGDGGIPNLKSLTVSPANATLTIDGSTAAVQAYTATGTFEDGHTADVTSLVTFSLGDPTLGTFTGPRFTSGTLHGGATSVFASAGGMSGSTGLSVLFKQRYNDPASTSLPANPGSQFGGSATTANAPELVYPNDGVLVPPNLGILEFHFKPGTGNALYELAFANAVTDVRIYLQCSMPMGGGCIYVPDATVWEWIAETNRGASALTVTLRGTDGKGGGVGTSNTLSVSFSADDIQGGIYYWKIAQNGDTGVMRFDFASMTQTTGQQFMGTEFSGGTCVGCHALSKDGTKLVAEAGGQNDGRILLMDVASKMPLVGFGTPTKSMFESWAPTGDRYVGVYGDSGATDYNLMFFDGATGMMTGDIPGTGTAANPADHPDWSNDGNTIAYVKIGIPNTNQEMYKGAIELVRQSGGNWGAPVEVVPAVDGKNHYYPAVSPDNGFIVYDESTCSAGNNSGDCNADTNPSARLFAVLPQASATPVELANANAGGRLDGATRDLTTSFPKWSPFVFKRTVAESGARLEWVTFASKRKFGLRTLPPSNRGGDGTLLWMAAVDPDKVSAGQDPSYTAFVLPFQDLTTSNHIAQWTQKVVGPIQ